MKDKLVLKVTVSAPSNEAALLISDEQVARKILKLLESEFKKVEVEIVD
jgi:hypothetical protein